MSVILVVDDDRDVRDLIEYKLRENGHEVITASNGDEALGLMRTNAPELLLLDVMMPGISGFDVLARVRANEGTRALPVIVLTAKAQASDAATGLALGADDYVTKPFSPRDLVGVVEAHLARVR